MPIATARIAAAETGGEPDRSCRIEIETLVPNHAGC